MSKNPNDDRSELANLYPRAKTFDDRRNDDKKRAARIARRRPHYAFLKIPLFGSLVFIALAFFALNVAKMWQSQSVALIFLSFLVWMALVGLVVWWARYVNATLYALGQSSRPFWTVNGFLFVVVSGVFLYSWQHGIANIILILQLGFAYTVLTMPYFLLKRG